MISKPKTYVVNANLEREPLLLFYDRIKYVHVVASLHGVIVVSNLALSMQQKQFV